MDKGAATVAKSSRCQGARERRISHAVGALGMGAALAVFGAPTVAVAGDDAGLIVCLVGVLSAQTSAREAAAVPNSAPAPTGVPQGDLRVSSLDSVN